MKEKKKKNFPSFYLFFIYSQGKRGTRGRGRERGMKRNKIPWLGWAGLGSFYAYFCQVGGGVLKQMREGGIFFFFFFQTMIVLLVRTSMPMWMDGWMRYIYIYIDMKEKELRFFWGHSKIYIYIWVCFEAIIINVFWLFPPFPPTSFFRGETQARGESTDIRLIDIILSL